MYLRRRDHPDEEKGNAPNEPNEPRKFNKSFDEIWQNEAISIGFVPAQEPLPDACQPRQAVIADAGSL